MSRIPRFILITLCLPGMLAAQQRYLDDTCFVPLRSGASIEHRILNQGIPSGTVVNILQSDTEAGWSEIRTAGGSEGWLPSRFLKTEPGAINQLRASLALLGYTGDQQEAPPLLDQAVSSLIGERDALTDERDSLREELAEMRQLSANAMELDQSNRSLNEELHMLRNRIGVLETENLRLQDDAWQQWFINGVWATGMGGLLTLLLPRLFTRRRRNSEWA